MGAVLCIALLATSMVRAQAPKLMETELEISKGTSVTMTWELDATDIPEGYALLYFRPRVSQTQAGSYNVGPKISADLRVYTFVPDRSVHLYITAWYSHTENDKVIVTESAGSNHMKITVIQ